MGFYDYITDLYSSLTIQDTLAESDKQFEGPTDTSGEQSKGSDTNAGGISTTQQRGGAAVKGGVSAGPGPSGTDEESAAEAEVNKEDLNKGGSGEGVKGHVAGEGGHSSGQRDTDSAGPHGGPLGEKAKNDAKGTAAGDSGAGDDEEEAGGDDDEEEEEEEDEPEDLKPKLEEGASAIVLVSFCTTGSANGHSRTAERLWQPVFSQLTAACTGSLLT